jgi:predicted O-methyltransferase YrrM
MPTTEMTPQRWENIARYTAEVFGRPDDQLRTLMSRAVAGGLPDIAISPDVGRLLKLLAGLTNGGRGPRLALELGALAGYSAIWLARALAPGGKLITVELEPRHADFAEQEFRAAGIADRIELIRAPALEALPAIARRLGPQSLDLVFVDAVKTEYAGYFRLTKPLLRPGALFLADNALGSDWWIDDPPGSSANRDAVDRFNRLVAADADFETAAVTNRQGLLIARKL